MIGTPGFQGQRLTEALMARGASVVFLADALGVSKTAIYQYKSGETTPSPDTLQKIADKLELPEEFFLTLPQTEVTEGLYRSFTAATKTERQRADVRLAWSYEIIMHLAQKVEFPPLNIPDLVSHRDIERLRPDEIEEIAIDLRRHWGLGLEPIGNLVWLLENNGVFVVVDNFDPLIQGLSAWHGKDKPVPIISIGTDSTSACRNRMTAAHELAHLILHRSIDRDRFKKEAKYRRDIETQAYALGNAIQMPRDSFGRDIHRPSLEAFRLLKRKWKASIQAMVMRADRLGLIEEWEKQRFWRTINRRGWRHFEPLDDVLPLERPNLLRAAVTELIDGGHATKSSIRALLPYSQKDIEGLCGLDPGYLSDEPAVPRIHGGAKIVSIGGSRNT